MSCVYHVEDFMLLISRVFLNVCFKHDQAYHHWSDLWNVNIMNSIVVFLIFHTLVLSKLGLKGFKVIVL